MAVPIALLPWLVFGCQDAAAPPAAAPAPAPVELVPMEPEARLADSVRPWRWYHRPVERDTSSFGAGALHDHTVQHLVDAPRRFVASRDGAAVTVQRQNRTQNDPPVDPAWSIRVDLGAIGPPVIGSTIGGPLVVAAPTAGGYALAALDPDSGTVHWSRTHEQSGSGPVQLQIGNDDVTVYVRRPAGAYLHVVSVVDGDLIEGADFGPEVHADAPAAPDDAIVPIARGRRAGRHRVDREGRTGLALEDSGDAALGQPGFRTVLVPEQRFDDHVVIVEAGDELVVVSFCSGAAGAFAYGLDPATGAIEWTSGTGNIGPIGHSMYRNVVRARGDGDRVIVYGDESAGQYVGVIDARRGRLLGYEVWRR